MSVSRTIFWRQLRLAVFFLLAIAVVFWLGNLVGQWLNFGATENLPRVPLQGTAFGADGRNGLIRFTPLSDNGILADGEITDGKFGFNDSNGPSAGRHRVHLMLEGESQKHADQKSKTEREEKKSTESKAAPLYDPMIELEVTVPSEAPYQLELELP